MGHHHKHLQHFLAHHHSSSEWHYVKLEVPSILNGPINLHCLLRARYSMYFTEIDRQQYPTIIQVKCRSVTMYSNYRESRRRTDVHLPNEHCYQQQSADHWKFGGDRVPSLTATLHTVCLTCQQIS